MRALLGFLLFSFSLSASAADVSVRFFGAQQEPRRPANEAYINAIVDSDSIERSNIRVRIAFDPSFEILEVRHWPFLWECTSAPGEVICTNPEFKLGADGQIMLQLRTPAAPRGGEFRFTADLTADNDTNPANNHAETVLYVIQRMLVTNTNDSGEGSLRAAIEQLNASCGRARPCDIRFVIPSVTVPVIEPLSPLPEITACGTVIGDLPTDIRAQPPLQVELRGTHAGTGSGLVLRTTCGNDDAYVVGLAVGGFPEDGVAIRGGGFYRIWGCRLGTDASGMQAVPNGLRGLAVTDPGAITTALASQISGNARSGIALWSALTTYVGGTMIGVAADGTAMANGTSGIFVAPNVGSLNVADSVIANNVDFGLALASTRGVINIGPDVRITGNRTLDIDWNLDGPSPAGDARVPPTPRIVSAAYDPDTNRTHVTYTIEPIRGGSLRLRFYASEGRTRFGTAHLDTFLGERAFNAGPGGTFTEEFEGDLRGKWISAWAQAWTVQLFPDSPAPSMMWPSEVSEAVKP
ncbi:MAG TPA: hypothetical protein VNI54_03680 [Thermoanaerobaculia bacterium]|nr:hypothetical protein [Thermoanaerobaculia bacterium]